MFAHQHSRAVGQSLVGTIFGSEQSGRLMLPIFLRLD